jgi:beta-glucosidase
MHTHQHTRPPCCRFGLSYTDFELGWSAQQGEAAKAVVVPVDRVSDLLPNVTFSVKVTNTGQRAGKETVMAFWSPPSAVDAELIQQLFDFQAVVLAPGASATLIFKLPLDAATIATVSEQPLRFSL